MKTEEKKPEQKKIKRTKEVFLDMQIEEFFQRKKVNDIYKTEYLLQRVKR